MNDLATKYEALGKAAHALAVYLKKSPFYSGDVKRLVDEVLALTMPQEGDK